MKRGLSVVIKLLTILLVMFCVTWGYLLYKVKQPAFQREIVAAISKQIGRPMEVKGGCTLSLVPLGVKLSDVDIRSPSGWRGQDFLKIGDFRLQVELASLLEGKVEVERIIVKDFALNLLADQRRGNNWSYWGEREQVRSEPDRETDWNYLSLLKIDSLRLERGTVGLVQDGQQLLKVALDKVTVRDLEVHDTAPTVSWLPSVIGELGFKGDAHFDLVEWRGLALRDVELRLQAKEGELELLRAAYRLGEDGECELHGKWSIAQLPTKLAADWKIERLRLRDLMPLTEGLKKVDGVVSASGNLEGDFAEPDELLRQLVSSGRLEVRDGLYEGIDIPYQIRRARDLLRRKVGKKDGRIEQVAQDAVSGKQGDQGEYEDVDTKRTLLDRLVATWRGKRGVLELTEVVADTADCALSGKGQADLIRGTIDAKLNVKLKKDELVDVPLNIRGELVNPEVSLDIGQLLKDQLHNLIPQALGGKLGKMLGGKVKGDAAQVNGLTSGATKGDTSVAPGAGDNAANDTGRAVDRLLERGLGELLGK